MGNSYIPAQEANALEWMQTFAAGISANVNTYMLSNADATAITNAVEAFATARAVAIDPVTRSPVNVNLKDTARNSAEQICRQYATVIKYNAGISDADKIAIGVRPVNHSREPIPPPTSSPLLNVLGATPGSQTVRYADTNTPDSAAKPFNAACLQLFVAIGAEPVFNADTAQFYGTFTRNPVAVGFAEEDDGKVATFFGRWATRKGEVGPWSLPVSMRIAA